MNGTAVPTMPNKSHDWHSHDTAAVLITLAEVGTYTRPAAGSTQQSNGLAWQKRARIFGNCGGAWIQGLV